MLRIRRQTLLAPALVLVSALSCSLDVSSPGLQEEVFSSGTMTGAQEQPMPVQSTASGVFNSVLRDTATVGGKRDSLATLAYELSAQSIDAVTAAHIHAGGPTVAGPVMVVLYNGPTTSDGFSGLLSRAVITRTTTFSSPFTFDSLVTRMRNGTAYVNVHTTRNSGGEVRGQIQKVAP